VGLSIGKKFGKSLANDFLVINQAISQYVYGSILEVSNIRTAAAHWLRVAPLI